MADVLLSSDDLLVIGGPTSIDLQLDYGSKGTRGSQIFLSNGNPNTGGNILDTPLINDVAINTSAADTEEYLYLYQYKYVDAVLAWHPYLKLLPNQFNANYSVVFTAGVGTVTVEIPSIALPTTGAAYSASNFNIQATVSNSSPTAVSVEIGTVTPGDVYTLPITLRAAQYSSSTWSSVNSTKLVYLAISVV
jgi:hypothetical protein